MSKTRTLVKWHHCLPQLQEHLQETKTNAITLLNFPTPLNVMWERKTELSRQLLLCRDIIKLLMSITTDRYRRAEARIEKLHLTRAGCNEINEIIKLECLIENSSSEVTFGSSFSSVLYTSAKAYRSLQLLLLAIDRKERKRVQLSLKLMEKEDLGIRENWDWAEELHHWLLSKDFGSWISCRKRFR